MNDTLPIPPRGSWLGRLFSRRNIARGLFAVACLATLIALLYAEENWRGRKAWEEAKSRLQAKGRVFDWAAYIPAPVPDDQNVFRAPGMESFIKDRSNTFSPHFAAAFAKLPPRHYTNRAPLVAATLEVVPRQTQTDNSQADAVLDLGGATAQRQALQQLDRALGPNVDGPQGYMVTGRDLYQTRPARIIIRSATPVSVEDLASLFPTNASAIIGPAASHLRIESAGSNSFRVVTAPPSGVIAAEYLAATDPLEADFDLMRQALTRPGARMDGNYEIPYAMPIPNFVFVRTVAQTLSQRAQCHLMLSRPDAAWHDLALVRDICRLLSPKPADKPVTLVSAMIEVAVTGLYTQIVKDGLRLHAWREPQLTAIEAQLKQARLLPAISAALDSEWVATCFTLENISPNDFATAFGGDSHFATTMDKLKNPLYLFCQLAPRGWVRQNMASIALRNLEVLDTIDSTNDRIAAASVDAFAQRETTRMKQISPYTRLAAVAVPNFTKALQTVARNQTWVDEAQVACALERYRLANGAYPESLDALAPQFIDRLPHDLFTGKPFRYQLTPDAGYLLYSVGWNRTDDGGVPGAGNLDGDWGWRLPGK